jgi:hypothetical protein
VTVVAAAALAAGAAFGTTAPSIIVQVHVTITDSKITVTPKRAPRGSDAQFIVRNVGTKLHTFTLGTAKRSTGKQTGFSRVMAPHTQKILLLYLDYRGALPYFSNTPADKAKSGMHGTFTVGGDVTGSVDG